LQQFSATNHPIKEMKAGDLIRLAKTNLGRVAAFLAMLLAAFAILKWFSDGLVASKWIDLPQYASAMQHLQRASSEWGIAALALESLALGLSLFPIPKAETAPTVTTLQSSHPVERSRFPQLVKHCAARTALCVLGTAGLILIAFVIGHIVGSLIGD
jgi:hypothetical protein